MRLKGLTIGMVLAMVALSSAALTLGRARGAAWIGQPLDLVISVQLDPGQSDTNVCPDADVYYGDSRTEASRVRVIAEPSKEADTVNLRVISNTLIDEPVVTVYARAGCAQKVSRRYVLLADFPPETSVSRNVIPVAPAVPVVSVTEAAATSAPVTSAPAASAPLTSAPTVVASTPATPPVNTVAVSPVAAAPTAPAPSAPAASVAVAAVPVPATAPPVAPPKATPVAQEKAAVRPPVVKPVQAQTPAKAPASPPAAASKPRLKLDPVDIPPAPAKTAPPVVEPVPSSADSGDTDAKQMEALQANIKALLDQSAKNEATLLALRERLEKAESEHVPMLVVYGLGALVFLAFGALVYVWNGRSRNVAREDDVAEGNARPGAM